jgi:muconolactone D-isomerase
MDFLVELSTALPPTWLPEIRDELLAREAARGAELRESGVLRALWRLPGRLANVGIWSVPDTGALHAALTSLPAWPWMTVRVTALAPHPLFTPDPGES